MSTGDPMSPERSAVVIRAATGRGLTEANSLALPMYNNKAQRDFARTLRNNPANAEKHLWRHLRAEQIQGHKFRRQASIGRYTVDFICFAKKLIIELDGPQHLDPPAAERDQDRDEWLTSRGYQILRFRNQQLDENIREVIDAISHALQASPLPNPPLQGEGTNP